jgi:peroxiredoxin Q/BCP
MNPLLLLCTSILGTYLNVHDTAPDFKAADSTNTQQALAQLVERGPVILAFFPKAFTSGCTQELSAFVTGAERLKKHGAQVVAISSDSADTLEKFKADIKADYMFIPDPEGRIMQMYQVKAPLVTYAKRTTFVIDRKRKIVHIDEGSSAVNVQAALDALDKLGAKTP